MMTRTLSRWLISIALAVLALVAINLLVTTTSVQGQPAAALINCAGSIQACIDDANDGDTILIAAGRYTESLTLSKPVSLTGVNSATTIIHAVAGQRVLTVTGAMISNSVVISGLTFTGGNADSGGGILADHDLNLIDVRIMSNTAQNGGGGLLAGGVVNLVNTDFISNSAAQQGSGILALTVTIKGGRFERNTGSSALFIENSLELTGTQFISNVGREGGGAAFVGQTAWITNAYFQGNQCFNYPASSYGGALYLGGSISTTNRFVIEYSTFVHNYAYLGGGIAALGNVTLINSRFENNNSYYDGGGIFADEYGPLIISDSVFISNSSQLAGGGIRAWGPLTITHSQLIQNRSTQNAGGGLAAAGETLIEDTQFMSNTAFGPGGGAIAWMTTTIQDSQWEGNRCISWGCFGGALVAINDLHIVDSRFISNSATYWGGGLYREQMGGGRIENTLFAQNGSTYGGAAVYLKSDGVTTILHTTIADTISNTTSAIAIVAGSVEVTNTIITNHAIAVQNAGGAATEDFNLFFQNAIDSSGVITGSNSLTGNPRFLDPAHGNYHLGPHSAAIDRGVDAGVYVDLDGKPRPVGVGFDIGAYEFQLIKVLYLPLIRK
jgi:predicted outer membrane repeat protein